MVKILENKEVWLVEANQFKWNKFKQNLFNNYGVHNLRFFHDANELQSVLMSLGTKSLPDLILCEFTGSFLSYAKLWTSKFSEIRMIVQFDTTVPSLVDSIDCYKMGISDIVNWNEVGSVQFAAKMDSFSTTLQKESKVDFSSGVRLDGVWIKNLTSKQIQFVGLFLGADNRTINRETILEEIWEGIQVHPKVVDVHLYNLRRKLGPFGFMIKSKGGGAWSLISSRIDREVRA